MNDSITKDLLEKYLEGKCTLVERELVEFWYASFDAELPLFEGVESNEALQLQKSSKAIIDEALFEHTDLESKHSYDAELNVFELNSRKKIFTLPNMVAASVLLLLLSGIIHLFSKTKTVNLPVSNQSRLHQKDIIVPGGTKAVLTLADGRTIILDSAETGALTMQGNTRIVKLKDGRLVYDASQGAVNGESLPVSYNTLSTPRGAQYQLILPDGSKVWLNAASSITYPTAFSGKERVVEITGEAYFEIAKKIVRFETGNEEKTTRLPFIVKVKGMKVEVLGTHFNVNAYNEENTINTTLLEGSVKVVKNNKQVLIHPGEQAMLNSSGVINVEDADVNSVVAWKNGLFQFKNASIQAVMQQVARWYDVEVEYKGVIAADRFQGKLYRNTDIRQLLKILELSGAHFQIEGKKIIVQ